MCVVVATLGTGRQAGLGSKTMLHRGQVTELESEPGNRELAPLKRNGQEKRIRLAEGGQG
jgi:hypothetical protein